LFDPEKSLIGCRRCGHVTRRDSLEGLGESCPECGTPMAVLPLEVARRLVSKRRAADRRRAGDAAVSDVGLEPEVEL
jgi:predicted  nucleic acid-binding Zn-ribbon protein